jgi:HEAT repeat protein
MSVEVVARLEAELLSANVDVTRKYRALFALRNVANESAVRALEKCLLQADADESRAARESSALLKHEVAYALGQIGHESSIATLERVLSDAHAHPMVRHEAGEALGAIGVPQTDSILLRFVHDPVREVAETCQLALDRLAFFRKHKCDFAVMVLGIDTTLTDTSFVHGLTFASASGFRFVFVSVSVSVSAVVLTRFCRRRDTHQSILRLRLMRR